ncbi:ABC-type sugar transport system ATPase subunit [Peribacillus simplex]|nr:ABC-type sugar transport system ATPase subunit [Peribacillus simplex]
MIDNVMFPALVSKDAVYQKAKKLMEMTGIEKLADNTITQGSGGQLQIMHNDIKKREESIMKWLVENGF